MIPPALALSLLLVPSLQAKDWGELTRSARVIYYVPLEETPYDAVLQVMGSGLAESRASDRTLKETLAGAGVFKEFNAEALKRLEARFGERARPAPESFRVEKKGLLGTTRSWDWKALDCDFYVLAQIEGPGSERGARWRLTSMDMAKRAEYVSLMPAPVTLTLYHKPKPDHSGKRAASAQSALLGGHSAMSVSGRSSEDLIEDRVAAEIEGREAEHPLETYHFAWSKRHYEGSPDALGEGFRRHAGRLRSRFRERLFAVLDGFDGVLDKKLK